MEQSDLGQAIEATLEDLSQELAKSQQERAEAIANAVYISGSQELFDLISRHGLAAREDKASLGVLEKWWRSLDPAVRRTVGEQARRYGTITDFWMDGGPIRPSDKLRMLDAHLRALRKLWAALLPPDPQLKEVLAGGAALKKQFVSDLLDKAASLLNRALGSPATKPTVEGGRDQRFLKLWCEGKSYKEIRELELEANPDVKALEWQAVKQAVRRLWEPEKWPLRVRVYMRDFQKNP